MYGMELLALKFLDSSLKRTLEGSEKGSAFVANTVNGDWDEKRFQTL